MRIELEHMLYDHICNLCETKNMPPIDLRFKCFGDVNRFYSSSTDSYFEISCVNYCAANIEDAKELVAYIIETLWKYATKPNHRVALYIEDVENKFGWVNMVIGGCLLEDDALL